MKYRPHAIAAAGLALTLALPTVHAAEPSAPPVHASAPHAVPKKKAPPAKPQPLVDINSASKEQLKTLPGIGDAEAERIIAGRPYPTKAHLVTSHVLPTGPFLSIKGLIIAKPPKKTDGKV